MKDIAYDPDLPFAVVRVRTPDSRVHPMGIMARFRHQWHADEFAGGYAPGWIEVIDTTPKPHIPENARYICFLSSLGPDSMMYARRYGNPGNRVWQFSNPVRAISEEELLGDIGDREITVLEEVTNG